jgi:hypothetical protein
MPHHIIIKILHWISLLVTFKITLTWLPDFIFHPRDQLILSPRPSQLVLGLECAYKVLLMAASGLLARSLVKHQQYRKTSFPI